MFLVILGEIVMYYIFPFHLIPNGADIILYGAGNAGKNYAKQIEITHYCNILAVVDKNFKKASVRNYKVISVDRLKEMQYDYIFITPISEKVQNEIRNELEEIGIEKNKIISFVSPPMDWDRPNRGYLSQNEEYELNKNVGNYIEKIDPSLLLSSDRIDVIVRYLLFKDFMNEIDNKEHLSLFYRFTMARTGGNEFVSYFSGSAKSSAEEFIQKGKELCKSIKEDGFAPRYFIPLGNNRKPYDGLHRMAAALAAGEKIYVKDYSDRDALDCNLKWFEEQGFSVEDRIRIVRGFTDIYPGKCGIFVLWSPFSDLWNFMECQIANHFKVVGVLDFNYDDNYIAFENVLRQIYSDWDHYSEWLTRKLDMLSLSKLTYRVIVVSDEKGNIDFYNEMKSLKHMLRDALTIDIDSMVPIQLHSSDNEIEFDHLKKIFLSANQYKWDMRKVNTYYRGWFIDTLNNLKQLCYDNNISINDICIVGSAVLELYGIRDAKNINFIVKSGVNFDVNNDTFEKKSHYALDENNNIIENDIVINDDEYHTVFSDLKFINPEFVYRNKKFRNSEKDKVDLAKIESWKKLVIGMDDKRYLNQQVERELYKRGLIK